MKNKNYYLTYNEYTDNYSTYRGINITTNSSVYCF